MADPAGTHARGHRAPGRAAAASAAERAIGVALRPAIAAGLPAAVLAFLSAAVLVLLPAAARAQRPVALIGSRDRLAEQNRMADALALTRMPNAAAVRRMADSGLLVRVPGDGEGYVLDEYLGGRYRHRNVLHYARPWVRGFLAREGERFAEAFPGARFKVSSLIRTLDYQELLKRRNVNAARGDDDDTRSPHLTGAALDISKKGLSRAQLAWWRAQLVALQDDGWIIAEEEVRTNAFHIFVHPGYARVADPARAGQD